jgi:hypothetical protein
MFPFTDLFRWRTAGNFATTVTCVCALSACSVGPRLTTTLSRCARNPVTTLSGVEPSVAVAGLQWTRTRTMGRRSYGAGGRMLRSVAASVSQNNRPCRNIPKPRNHRLSASSQRTSRITGLRVPRSDRVESSRDQLPSGAVSCYWYWQGVQRPRWHEVDWSPGVLHPLPDSPRPRYVFTVSAPVHMGTGSAITEASAIDDGLKRQRSKPSSVPLIVVRVNQLP